MASSNEPPRKSWKSPLKKGANGSEKSEPSRFALKDAFGALLGDHAQKAFDPDGRISQSQVERFVQLSLSMEADQLLGEVESLMAKGVGVEAVYVELLAPAARHLGKLWEDDACDFVDVTMGLWRLQQVLQEISARVPARIDTVEAERKKALFLPMPGEQHYFGAQMLDDVFARSGWNTHLIMRPRRREMLDLLASESFDLLGLTLTRDCPSAGPRNLINVVRSVSRNKNISILVGGHMINQNPAVVAEVGADGTGADARAALEVAEALVQSAKVRTQTLR